jgi:hypothetical protein
MNTYYIHLIYVKKKLSKLDYANKHQNHQEVKGIGKKARGWLWGL